MTSTKHPISPLEPLFPPRLHHRVRMDDLIDAVKSAEEQKFLDLDPSFSKKSFTGACVALACFFGWSNLLEEACKHFYYAKDDKLNFSDAFLKEVLSLMHGTVPLMLTKPKHLVQLGMYLCVVLDRFEMLETMSRFFELRMANFAGEGLIQIALKALDGEPRKRMVSFLITKSLQDQSGERIYSLVRDLLEDEQLEYASLIVQQDTLLDALATDDINLYILAIHFAHQYETEMSWRLLSRIRNVSEFGPFEIISYPLRNRKMYDFAIQVVKHFGPRNRATMFFRLELMLKEHLDAIDKSALFYELFPFYLNNRIQG